MNKFKKTIGLILFCLTAIGLTSCTVEIPEGDIRDFVYKIDYDKTFEQFLYGTSTITAIHYINDAIEGQIETTTYIDKSSKQSYRLMETKLSGSYYGTGIDQFNYYSQEILCYFDESEKVYASQKTDGVIEELKYSDQDIRTAINQFFYTKIESGYHSGGMYYGDYILSNCGKFYNFFSLNEEKTELTYEINSMSYDQQKQKEIITRHHYVVDQYGMLLNLTTKTFYKETPQTYMQTIVKCDYTKTFTKKITLD